MFSTLQNTSYDWGYHADYSNKAGRLFEKNISWPSGKFIGGSGGMNAMFYVRGNQKDFDNWELLGNPTWNWQNVVEYFKKAENYTLSETSILSTANLTGSSGPLRVNAFNNAEPFKQLLFDAAKELGYITLDDVNGNEKVGFGTAPGTLDQGVRYNAAKAYLSAAANRTNLHLIKFAHVIKLNVDNTTGQVSGVEFSINKTHALSVNAIKEVVLSAGSIGTPQILQLSGIGPEKYMRRLNISSIRNLHSGWSMQSHISIPLFWKFNETVQELIEGAVSSNETVPDMNASTDELYSYIKNRTGVFSQESVFDAIGFINANPNLTDVYPNISTQYVVFKRNDILFLEFLKNIGLNDTTAQPLIDANKVAEIAVAFVTLLNPSALGKVHLNSADPYDLPRIQANYLDRPDDIETIVQGIQRTRQFLETSAFNTSGVTEIQIPISICESLLPKKVKKPKATKPPKTKSKKDKKHKNEETTEAPVTEPVPQPELIPYGSDQYWQCYIKHLTTTPYQPVGTAKMGPATDRFAVVDSRLKVHGLNGLRVVDESIMPKIVSANIHASIVMIAEKGSDFIKEDYPEVATETVPEPYITSVPSSSEPIDIIKDEL